MRVGDIVRTAALAVGVLLVTGPSAAQVANDACEDAESVGPGTFAGTTEGATNDGAASCGESDTSPDVWYRVVTPVAGVLTASTCTGSFVYDTVVSIHESCPGGEADQIACNDDACDPIARQSIAQAEVEAGGTYWVRVAGWRGDTGTFDLTLDLAEGCTDLEGADQCGDAVLVGSGCYAGTTAGAGSDGDAGCGSSGSSPDRWYQCVPAVDGTLTVNTCGETFFYDTVLSIHTGCPGEEVGCVDDACNVHERQSTLSVPVSAGESYWIRVSGYDGARGEYELRVDCPGGVPFALASSGTCPGRFELQAVGATAGGSVAFAFDSAPGSWTIPSGGCAGTELGLDGTHLLVLGVRTADGLGQAAMEGPTAPGMCGGLFQAVDLDACVTSEPVVVEAAP